MPFGWFLKSALGDKEILHLVIMVRKVVVPMMMMAVVMRMRMMIDDDDGRSWQPFGKDKNGHKNFRPSFNSI